MAESLIPANALAQATIDSGQGQLLDLSRKATQAVYLVNGTQTAQAQAVLDAQALQNAQTVVTLTAYPLTETAKAQVIVNAQATETAQAVANMTAYPMTATPFAVTKAALLMQQYGREQQSFVNQIVIPFIPIMATLDLLLFILLIIFGYRRFMLRPRPLSTSRFNDNPRHLIMVDSVASDHDPHLRRIIPYELMPFNPSGLPGNCTVRVEIVNATEPPVAHWIAEAERQLANEGGLLV